MTTEKNRQPVVSNPDARALVPTDPPVTGTAQNSGRRHKKRANLLTIVPVRNAVLFPHNVVPFIAGRDIAMDGLEFLAKSGATIGIVTQKEGGKESAAARSLHPVGTEAKVLKVLRFGEGNFGVVVQGLRRFHLSRFESENEAPLQAEVEFLAEEPPVESLEFAALYKSFKQLAQKAIALSPQIPNDVGIFLENLNSPSQLACTVIPYLSIDVAQKQELLEIENLEEQLKRLYFLLTREIEILEISQKIHTDLRSEMTKQQRKQYVREQVKLLQKELSTLDDKPASAANQEDIQTRVENSRMPQDARDAALREVERMQSMQTGSPEYTVSLTYVNWLLDLPWGICTQEPIDLKRAKQTLDEDHFGLEKVKSRIIEFLAVYSIKRNHKGPILLFVGPPGVGKTSLGRSIARTMGRKFARISLGGIRDECEIRGHRRTYIGSMPGKIIDAIKKSGSMDPVIMLDEVDKLASDHKGDPSSALLEVLDPEQNNSFTDHYLNVPVDLSKVLFICTANDLYSIPSPLKDRMEQIELTSYTLIDKTHIAYEHLLPKLMKDHGLDDHVHLQIQPETMRSIVQQYTREAGVRQLGRELSAIARHVARELVESGAHIAEPGRGENRAALRARRTPRKLVDLKFVRESLGPAKFLETRCALKLKPGVAMGLAYTPAGGDILFVETVVSRPGSGKVSITGQLGDVMRESVETALSYLRSSAPRYGLQDIVMKEQDLHVHFPEGAVRKDGPSAGVAIFLALASQFSGEPVAASLAMTGEISLRGDVLPVGGIKEKLMAAHRSGITTVLIPFENEKDLVDVPAQVKQELTIVPIRTMDEAFELAFSAHSPNRGRSPRSKSPHPSLGHSKKTAQVSLPKH